MTPAADDEISSSHSSVPLLSRRRGSLSASATLDTSCNDIERGGSAHSVGESINVRVKTAGDGREYKLSTPLTATVAEVSGAQYPPCAPRVAGRGFSRIYAMMIVFLFWCCVCRTG